MNEEAVDYYAFVGLLLVFLLDLIIPDPLPFVDEFFLGVGVLYYFVYLKGWV